MLPAVVLSHVLGPRSPRSPSMRVCCGYSCVVPVGRRHESFDFYDTWPTANPADGQPFYGQSPLHSYITLPPPFPDATGTALTAKMILTETVKCPTW